MPPRKRLKHALVAACIAAIVAAWWSISGPSQLAKRPESPSETYVFCLKMLKQEVKDKTNWTKRAASGHLAQVAPCAFWRHYYPVDYAREKLLSVGVVVVDPLLRVVHDSSQEPSVRHAAADALSFSDDPRIASTLLQLAEAEQIAPGELLRLLSRHIPLVPMEFWLSDVVRSPGLAIERLRTFVAKDYDTARLEMLDVVVLGSRQEGGFEHHLDPWVMRWLNRIADADLDVWLAQAAPYAARFRDAQLKNGYDPIVTCRRFLSGDIDTGGIDAVFPDSAQSQGCRELMQVMLWVDPAFRPPIAPGWEDRLRAWYRANRPYFVYDFQKHRFVVDKSRSPSSATASAPAPRIIGAGKCSAPSR